MLKYPVLAMLLLLLAAGPATAAKDTVTFSGLTFTPSLLNVNEGDTVVFVLSAIHNALEVSQATWNANGTTPLGGGFSVPFGGGAIVASGIGTHYYVCTNHALSSMKGRIVVSPAVVPFSSITLTSTVDRDGNIATSSDRIGKSWSLKLYLDSVASGIVVDSVASGTSLLADSLDPGTYVAVEADSAHWTHISQEVDGISQGLTALNYRQLTVGAGENRAVEFLNYAGNVVISSGFTFVPDTIVVDSSDTVRFVLDMMHNAREVDSAAWLAGDTLPNGGFEVPYGGGDVVPPAPGVYRYVCVPHAGIGMKGVVIVKSAGSLTLEVAEGWNLLSLPFVPADGSVAAVYPTATTPAFVYDAGYQSQSTVAPGKGYWLKFGGAQQVDLDGEPIAVETVAVAQGWNIVGSISDPVPVSGVQSDPGGLITSPFYGYDAGYSTADTLQPGFGYWVKVGSAGALILQAFPGAAPAAGLIRIVPVSEVPVVGAGRGEPIPPRPPGR